VKSYLRNHRADHENIDKQGILLNIACDVASGLQAMHLSNFVHRFVVIVMAGLWNKAGHYIFILWFLLSF